jgi:hypothetical protein
MTVGLRDVQNANQISRLCLDDLISQYSMHRDKFKATKLHVTTRRLPNYHRHSKTKSKVAIYVQYRLVDLRALESTGESICEHRILTRNFSHNEGVPENRHHRGRKWTACSKKTAITLS